MVATNTYRVDIILRFFTLFRVVVLLSRIS